MSFDVVAVTDEKGAVVAPELLVAAESVHCQLRPHLAGRYVASMQRVFADGGEMCLLLEGREIRAVAVFRMYENTSAGKHMYVDDLVTDEAKRSRGAGRALLQHLQKIALVHHWEKLLLDSGTQRTRAHAFYFREGFTINSFHFVKPLY